MKICCDIDGVLADVRDYVEEYLNGQKKKDWKQFYAKVPDFPYILPMTILINNLISVGHDVFFITGRPETVREETLKWLNVSFPVRHGHLIMRPAKGASHLHTHEIKMVHYLRIQPDMIIDDDPDVIEAIKDSELHDIPVLQVHGFRTSSKDNYPKDDEI